jgi:hypothetical protein
MYFTVTGLPASLTASNLDPQGNATGTLTIQGTPLPGDAGLHSVQIMARNGVGATAQQTLMLDIAKLKERHRLQVASATALTSAPMWETLGSGLAKIACLLPAAS